ncbi:MAG: hypothetical protein IPJ66_17405 [Bacteroidetes bacterium]|nr:hypothetical protein [Bacteroidota bacterium]
MLLIRFDASYRNLYNIIELANNHYLTTANSSVIEFDSSFGFCIIKGDEIDQIRLLISEDPFDDNFVLLGIRPDPNTNETKYAIINLERIPVVWIH